MRYRMRYHLVLKFLGISAFMWVFFLLYFHLLRNPVHPVTVMPLTALDRAIPFQPEAFAAYVSLWLYVGIPVGLMLSLREVLIYGLWIGSLCVAGLACFYFWPTAVPPYDFTADVAGHKGFALLQGVDAAGNACPSLHVATATFTAVWVQRLLQLTQARPLWTWINLVWLLLIIYSTLAIKQHVVLDALAGVALALAFAWPSLRWHPPALR
jgi:PAP2 superfamily